MHRDPEAMERLTELAPSSVVICTPVAAEISYGLARLELGSRRRELLSREYALIRSAARWVDWTESAARRFGELKANLMRAGSPIEDLDIAIASVARDLDARVATRNVRHFERVEGLRVDDWSRRPGSE